MADSNTSATALQGLKNHAFETMDKTNLLPATEMSAPSVNDAAGEPAGHNALPQGQPSTARDGGAPDNGANNDAMSMPPAPRPSKVKEQERREKALIHMYHVLLLLLTLRDEKPVVHLDNPNAIRILDACMVGLISDKGAIISQPPARKGAAFADWVAKCDKYVPKIRTRIEANSNENIRLPQNAYMGPGTHPEHKPLWKFVISPELLDVFMSLLKAEGISDEMEYPEAAPEMIKDVLEGIIDGQYDFDAWVHLEYISKRKFNQPMPDHPEGITEEFHEDRDHPGMILSVVKIEVPGTNETKAFTSLFADLPAPVPRRKKGNFKAGEKRRPTFFRPTPDSVTVPKKHKKVSWIHSGGNLYHRPDGESWELFPFVREFDAETGEYVALRFVNLTLLANVQPNVKKWKTDYNKYFSQLRQRDPNEKPTRVRIPWIPAEKKLVYRRINEWCQQNGVNKFRDKIFSKASNIDFVKKVNEIQNKGRKHDSVGSWFNTAVKKEQGPIGVLAKKARKLQERLDNGETLPRAEQYPDEAIPLSDSEDDEELEGADDGDHDNDSDGGSDDGEQDGDEGEQGDGEGGDGDESDDSEPHSDSGVKGGERIITDPDDCMDDANIDAFYPLAPVSKRNRSDDGEDDEQGSPRKKTKEEHDVELWMDAERQAQWERDLEHDVRGGDDMDIEEIEDFEDIQED
jgi:hypothetical protein